ncbi:MAG: uncharacterized protein A8A55_0353 [Amphiamblys sp. WSBS2006]|nr:MAG: uncharacterized protein A8A55_0353 [Amphiamblys sp. WSBS2006]
MPEHYKKYFERKMKHILYLTRTGNNTAAREQLRTLFPYFKRLKDFIYETGVILLQREKTKLLEFYTHMLQLLPSKDRVLQDILLHTAANSVPEEELGRIYQIAVTYMNKEHMHSKTNNTEILYGATAVLANRVGAIKDAKKYFGRFIKASAKGNVSIEHSFIHSRIQAMYLKQQPSTLESDSEDWELPVKE